MARARGRAIPFCLLFAVVANDRYEPVRTVGAPVRGFVAEENRVVVLTDDGLFAVEAFPEPSRSLFGAPPRGRRIEPARRIEEAPRVPVAAYAGDLLASPNGDVFRRDEGGFHYLGRFPSEIYDALALRNHRYFATQSGLYAISAAAWRALPVRKPPGGRFDPANFLLGLPGVRAGEPIDDTAFERLARGPVLSLAVRSGCGETLSFVVAEQLDGTFRAARADAPFGPYGRTVYFDGDECPDARPAGPPPPGVVRRRARLGEVEAVLLVGGDVHARGGEGPWRRVVAADLLGDGDRPTAILLSEGPADDVERRVVLWVGTRAGRLYLFAMPRNFPLADSGRSD